MVDIGEFHWLLDDQAWHRPAEASPQTTGDSAAAPPSPHPATLQCPESF